jgi:hypothetical protein
MTRAIDRRLKKARKRAAILAANGGLDPASLGAREARPHPDPAPPGDLASMIDDVIFRDYLKGLDPATGLPVKDGRSSLR